MLERSDSLACNDVTARSLFPLVATDLVFADRGRTLIDHLSLILDGRGALAAAPVRVLEAEHDDHAATLQRTRELTADLVPPAEACTTWRALYLRLEALEAELMEHIHLENNVLFRRVLGA